MYPCVKFYTFSLFRLPDDRVSVKRTVEVLLINAAKLIELIKLSSAFFRYLLNYTVNNQKVFAVSLPVFCAVLEFFLRANQFLLVEK